MTFQRAFMAMALCLLLGVAHVGIAAVSPEEAEKLKTTLTPFGAEKAGNKDGTIPAWEGGYKTVPPGYKSGDLRPDPFADEKPLFSITSKNMDQYSDMLSEGNKALLKKYPSYRLDVYPTHRTAAAPEYVYQNTFRNATRAKTKNNGITVEGAYGGIPFPIPKDGAEVMWNHLTAWKGEAYETEFRAYTFTPAGKRIFVAKMKLVNQYPYYYADVPMEKFGGDYFNSMMASLEPPYKAGEAFLNKQNLDYAGIGQLSWQYLTGQRRVRRAPTGFSYDTPNLVVSGVANWDELWIFYGAMDRYSWKIIGKKEMYIPYNENKFYRGQVDQILGEHFPNPDFVRWELHRVWVVEANLLSGKRHVVPKRRIYLDEDTWQAVLGEGWDAQGQLWKSYYTFPVIVPEIPTVIAFTNGSFNLQTGAWYIDSLPVETKEVLKVVRRRPDSFFDPDTMAGYGVR